MLLAVTALVFVALLACSLPIVFSLGVAAVVGLLPAVRTVVAVLAGWRPPPNTHAPDAITLALNASTSL